MVGPDPGRRSTISAKETTNTTETAIASRRRIHAKRYACCIQMTFVYEVTCKLYQDPCGSGDAIRPPRVKAHLRPV